MSSVRKVMLAASLLSGCVVGGHGASAEALTRRAAFDLNCDASQLVYQPIDSRTRGVAGCGRRATYVETCQDQFASNCTWVLNGAAASPQ
jgi:hypothetical protein